MPLFIHPLSSRERCCMICAAYWYASPSVLLRLPFQKNLLPEGISQQASGAFRTHDTRFKVWGANHYTMGAPDGTKISTNTYAVYNNGILFFEKISKIQNSESFKKRMCENVGTKLRRIGRMVGSTV